VGLLVGEFPSSRANAFHKGVVTGFGERTFSLLAQGAVNSRPLASVTCHCILTRVERSVANDPFGRRITCREVPIAQACATMVHDGVLALTCVLGSSVSEIETVSRLCIGSEHRCSSEPQVVSTQLVDGAATHQLHVPLDFCTQIPKSPFNAGLTSGRKGI
jgi:hypothetical protein